MEEVWLHAFLTTASDTGEWSASRPGRFNPGTKWTEGWASLRTGLDAMAKTKNPAGNQISFVHSITY
jgi:hypothetical protein